MLDTWSKYIVTDVKVEIEQPNIGKWSPYKYGTNEYWLWLEKEFRAWAKEVEEFVRDHRSQDTLDLSVVRVLSKKCKYCGYVYPENDEVPKPDCCLDAMATWDKEAAQELEDIKRKQEELKIEQEKANQQ